MSSPTIDPSDLEPRTSEKDCIGRLSIFLSISLTIHLAVISALDLSLDFSPSSGDGSGYRYLQVIRFSPPGRQPDTNSRLPYVDKSSVETLQKDLSLSPEEDLSSRPENDHGARNLPAPSTVLDAPRAEKEIGKDVAVSSSPERRISGESMRSTARSITDPKPTIDQILKQTRTIINDLSDPEESPRGRAGGVFDSDFRKKLERARREQLLLERSSRKREAGSKIETVGYNDSDVVERIGDRCWRIPVDKGLGPLDNRIIVVEPDCPGGNSRRLDLRRRTGGHEEIEYQVR